MIPVAPFTGAWIEIVTFIYLCFYFVVAPFTGAWIEIGGGWTYYFGSNGRSLHGSVD